MRKCHGCSGIIDNRTARKGRKIENGPGSTVPYRWYHDDCYERYLEWQSRMRKRLAGVNNAIVKAMLH